MPADATRYTTSSEFSPRNRKLDTLQIHHATTTSLSGLEMLMAPGGRTVSANEAMGSDGYRVRKVPKQMRAFTSASSFDNQSYTVEVCNTSLAPTWGISEAAHRRLAELAVELYRDGDLGSLSRRHIIQHREVPGTYATACAGPSMDMDRIVRYAVELFNTPTRPAKRPTITEDTMIVLALSDSYDRLIKKGWQYIQGADGPFRPINNLEADYRKANGEATHEWSGNDLRQQTYYVGLREAEPLEPGVLISDDKKRPLAGPGKLTGRIIYR